MDFLNSIASPVDTAVEWLSSGDDLLAWLAKAGVIPSAVVATLRKSALPGELDAAAAQARSLREWFRAFVHKHRGKPLDPEVLSDLKPLNQLLSRDQEFEQIVARKDDGENPPSLELARQRRWHSPNTLLLPIAEALADLICNENFADIKACSGPACSLLYVDRTRASSRRWCSMAVCGNRTKQAAHRLRDDKRLAQRSKSTKETKV